MLLIATILGAIGATLFRLRSRTTAPSANAKEPAR
jgi:hypothetical protein